MSRMLSFAAIVAILISPIASLQQAVAQNKSPQRRERPQPKPLRLQKVSPRLDQFLIDWYNATKKIKTIEGITYKFEYGSVFKIETRGEGKFYYESPDKGRLDIWAARLKSDERSRRIDDLSKVPYKLATAKPKIWLSTGINIVVTDEETKKAQKYEIPPENRGSNIMHGPLPFLLGMPPNIIKRRYRLTIESENDTHIRLKAIPMWKVDSANYREAKIILDKKTFLPSAVQLLGPSEGEERVFTFSNTKVNKKRILWRKNPIQSFNPAKYVWEDMMPKGGQQRRIITEKKGAGKVLIPGNQNQLRKPNKNRNAKPIAFKKNPQIKPVDRSVKLTVPNLIGLNHADAKIRLRKAGFDVVFKRGSVARTKSLEWRVEHQNPKPRTVSFQGNKIELVLYIKPSDTKPPARTDSKRKK